MVNRVGWGGGDLVLQHLCRMLHLRITCYVNLFERGKALTCELRDKKCTYRFLLVLFLFCLTQQPVAFR